MNDQQTNVEGMFMTLIVCTVVALSSLVLSSCIDRHRIETDWRLRRIEEKLSIPLKKPTEEQR